MKEIPALTSLCHLPPVIKYDLDHMNNPIRDKNAQSQCAWINAAVKSTIGTKTTTDLKGCVSQLRFLPKHPILQSTEKDL